jgi:predicted dehydrogenase
MSEASDSEVRLGIVGLGNWGGRLARTVAKVDGARLATCYARTPERREAFASEHGCVAVDSFEKFLGDETIDGVLVATPHTTHAEIVTAIAGAGKNIMVEKPLALTTRDARRCVKAARDAGVLLQVAHYRRLLTATRRIKAMLDAGELGRLHHIETNFSRPFGPDPKRPWRDEESEAPAGAMTALGVHMVDNLFYLGGQIKRLAALSSVLDPSTPLDDMTSVLFEFESGAHAVLNTSLRLPFVATTAAHGDKASAWSEVDGARLYVQKVGEEERSEFAVEPVDGVVANIATFVDNVRSGKEPETNGEAALNVVAVLDAIQQSAAADGAFVALELE